MGMITPISLGYYMCQCLTHGKYTGVAVILLQNITELYETLPFPLTLGSQTLSANSLGVYIFMLLVQTKDIFLTPLTE